MVRTIVQLLAFFGSILLVIIALLDSQHWWWPASAIGVAFIWGMEFELRILKRIPKN